MNTIDPPAINELTTRAIAEALNSVIRDGEPLVVVNSPPGAGKTTLVETAVAAAQHCGLRVAVATPRASQSVDVTRRLLEHYPSLPIELWLAQHRELPSDLATRADAVTPGGRMWRTLQAGTRVVVGTVSMFAAHVTQLASGEFDMLITDEGYQITWAAFAPLLHLAGHHLVVGDPGQLPPLVRVETARFEAARHKVHWSAPRELMRRFPETRIVRLPATYRLPQDTVDLIQPAFYEDLPFVSAANMHDRRVRLIARGFGDPIDHALELLAAGNTVVGILVPPLHGPLGNVDEPLADMMAGVVDRLLTRGVEWQGRMLEATEIGCVDPHVASGAAVRRNLQHRRRSSRQVFVDTPEIWQGLERPIMVVKHPLSGMRRLDKFGLEPGRWSVSLSRHVLGCVIVGRDGIGKSLEDHSHDCADRPMGSEDIEWAGWQAHQRVWKELERCGCLARV